MGWLRRMVLVMVGMGAMAGMWGCGESEGVEEGAVELYVISPHGADIRREFAGAFSEWHKRHYGKAVRIQWPDIGAGGTGNIATYLQKYYAANKSPELDVMFGGGSGQFQIFEGMGFLEKVPAMTSEDERVWGGKDPVAGVPGDIFGTPLKGKGEVWVAGALSSFGMVVNKDRVRELGLRMPTVWEDLAGPMWVGRISVADPAKSSSVRTSYEQVLQQYGWEKGWGILVQMFANAVAIKDSGSGPADDVGSAEAVGGIVIDFYGRLHVLRAGERLMGFVIPEGGSTVDADPIAMLKGAPHAALAGRFVRFVVSREGQRLWTFKPGTAGGPRKATLARMAVLPGLYTEEGGSMLDPRSPFAMAHPLKIDAKAQLARGKYIGDLLKSGLIDNHRELVEARQAIQAAGDPPDLLERLRALPPMREWEVKGGELVVGEMKPVREGDQEALAAQFAPAAGSAKVLYKERMQTALKDLWREELNKRFVGLEAEARGRVRLPER